MQTTTPSLLSWSNVNMNVTVNGFGKDINFSSRKTETIPGDVRVANTEGLQFLSR